MAAFQANLDTMEFKPVAPEDLGVELLEGDPDFQISAIRETADATGSVWAGAAKLQPCTFRYAFRANDTFFAVSGNATIVDETSGETIHVKPGDILSFPKGTPVKWTVESEFIEVFASTGV